MLLVEIIIATMLLSIVIGMWTTLYLKMKIPKEIPKEMIDLGNSLVEAIKEFKPKERIKYVYLEDLKNKKGKDIEEETQDLLEIADNILEEEYYDNKHNK